MPVDLYADEDIAAGPRSPSMDTNSKSTWLNEAIIVSRSGRGNVYTSCRNRTDISHFDENVATLGGSTRQWYHRIGR
jgi:hypothetical protein